MSQLRNSLYDTLQKIVDARIEDAVGGDAEAADIVLRAAELQVKMLA